MSFLTMPNNLDYERLAKNIKDIYEGEYHQRGSGRSTAYVYLMLGELGAGDDNNRYIYLAPTRIAADTVFNAMVELAQYLHLQESEIISVNRAARRLTDLHNNTSIFFCGIPTFLDRYDWGSRGEKIARIFFDIEEWYLSPRDCERLRMVLHGLSLANPEMDIV